MTSIKTVYNNWATYYDKSAHVLHTLEKQEVVKNVGPRPRELILDAACGTGNYAHELIKYGAMVVGVDFSEEMLKQASRKVNTGVFFICDLTGRLPFIDHYFDKVICSQALQHIKDISFTLKEFARITKKSGKIVISTTHPSMNWTNYNIKSSLARYSAGRPLQIIKRNLDSYYTSFKKNGFKIEATKEILIDDKAKEFFSKRTLALITGRPLGIIFVLRNRGKGTVD